MKYTGAIVLVALGAILAFAVNVDVQGIDINMIGMILIGVGIAGFIISVTLDLIPNKKQVRESGPRGDRRVEERRGRV